MPQMMPIIEKPPVNSVINPRVAPTVRSVFDNPNPRADDPKDAELTVTAQDPIY